MKAQEFSQYRAALSALATPALRKAAQQRKRDENSVLMGAPVGLILLADEDWLHDELVAGLRALATQGRANGGKLLPPPLRDPLGHPRDVYHPLVLHLHLAAFGKLYESLTVGQWSACEDALPDACQPARMIEGFANAPPPPAGTALVLWQSLCLLEYAKLAGRDVDVELVESVVHRIVSQPGPEGTLHARDAAGAADEESLDAWTYAELAGLHALASLALARRSKPWAARVDEIATWHLNNTQPDNTTNQPWAVAAFLWPPRTRSFAEQQMHDAQAHGVGPVAALLLADAAHTLVAFG